MPVTRKWSEKNKQTQNCGQFNNFNLTASRLWTFFLSCMAFILFYFIVTILFLRETYRKLFCSPPTPCRSSSTWRNRFAPGQWGEASHRAEYQRWYEEWKNQHSSEKGILWWWWGTLPLRPPVCLHASLGRTTSVIKQLVGNQNDMKHIRHHRTCLDLAILGEFISQTANWF